MQNELKVHVVNRGRAFLYLRYVDPLTGRPVERSAKTGDPEAALKEAGKWEDELRECRYKPR